MDSADTMEKTNGHSGGMLSNKASESHEELLTLVEGQTKEESSENNGSPTVDKAVLHIYMASDLPSSQ